MLVMTALIPETTETEYLTGITALNIPTEEGDFSDWHFIDTFLRGKVRFRIAGKNIADTILIAFQDAVSLSRYRA
jgi:hypothetical protein